VAISIATDVHIIVNGVTLSDHVTKVTTDDNRAKKDITCMGATSVAYAKGLGDASVSVTFLQDFAAGKVHATLQPLIGSSTPVNVEIRPTSGGRTATNPAYLISALLFNYGMVDAQVGEPSAMTCEFTNASQTGVTYPTA
jgi:hypothetical protein